MVRLRFLAALKRMTKKSDDTKELRQKVLNGDIFAIVWRGGLPTTADGAFSKVPELGDRLSVFHIAFLLDNPYRRTVQGMEAKSIEADGESTCMQLEVPIEMSGPACFPFP